MRSELWSDPRESRNDGLTTVHLDLGDEGQAELFMQNAPAVCERSDSNPDALVLPFLD